MSENLSWKTNFIKMNLQGKLTRAATLQAFLVKYVMQEYRNIQNKRWMTEGISEGEQWKPLSPLYAKAKSKRFMNYPGGGTKMLIATNKLFKSVIGPAGQEGYHEVVTNDQIRIGTDVDYAPYVNESRKFMGNENFSPESIARLQQMVADYCKTGKVKRLPDAIT